MPVIVGLFIFSKLSNNLKLFVFFFIFSALTDLIVLLLSLKHQSNIVVINIYNLVEMLFLLYLYNSISNSPGFRNALKAIAFLYCVLWFSENLLFNSLKSFHPLDDGVKGFIFIFFSIWLLLLLANDIRIPLTHNYRFWLVFAFLLYFSTTIIVYLTSTWFISFENVMAMHYTWFIHSAVTILTNILATYGIICFYQRKNLYSSSQ
jgi:hypothetical protein